MYHVPTNTTNQNVFEMLNRLNSAFQGMTDISKDRFKLYHEFFLTSFLINVETVLIRNPICDIVTKWIKSCLLPCFGTFKMPILMFNSILVFRPEGQRTCCNLARWIWTRLLWKLARHVPVHMSTVLN